ncbi:MAG: serine/threonine protein kinase, partial [Planctomycetes bacterium]|nr:serine/threonine protein kinase [Planctomycetota bacterium]
MVDVPGYRIHHLLSWGSQGDVFLATDAAGERVALKIVDLERVDGDPAARERLRREARLLRAVASPHVVGVRALIEDERYGCLVLDYLDGVRLDRAMRRRAGIDEKTSPSDSEAATVVLGEGEASSASAPSPSRPGVDARIQAAVRTPEHVAWALQMGTQLARGVAALHQIDLVHRDLKPANAMLDGDRVKLIDFGLARTAGVTTLTQSGAVVGSLAFMSPEQFRGRAATKRSDVYGLGATLHFLLVGEPPHGDQSA